MSIARPSRPAGVSLIVFVAGFSAAFTILVGVLVIAVSPTRAAGAGRSGAEYALVLGLVLLAVGLVTAAVTTRLSRGGNGARMVVSALEVLQIAGALASISTHGARGTYGSSWVTIALALLVLGLLWNSRANAFFSGRSVPR